MSSFHQFMAVLMKNSIARSNRFQVIIPLPAVLQHEEDRINANNRDVDVSPILDNPVVKVLSKFFGYGNDEMTRGLEVMIEQTEFPGKSYNMVDVKYNADVFKFPSSIIYAAQQFTFHVSRDMYEKTIIDAWMNLIVNPNTHEVSYHDDYVTNIIINQLGDHDEVIHSVMLIDAFPMMTNPLIASHAETNMGHRLMCMFGYRKWKRLKENETQPISISGLAQTPFGPYITPILSIPAISKALEIFENNTGIDLEGEAVNIYNQVDDIVRATTGSSINKSTTLLEGIRASVLVNNKITPDQVGRLLSIIDDAIAALKS